MLFLRGQVGERLRELVRELCKAADIEMVLRADQAASFQASAGAAERRFRRTLVALESQTLATAAPVQSVRPSANETSRSGTRVRQRHLKSLGRANFGSYRASRSCVTDASCRSGAPSDPFSICVQFHVSPLYSRSVRKFHWLGAPVSSAQNESTANLNVGGRLRDQALPSAELRSASKTLPGKKRRRSFRLAGVWHSSS
jgi:hypothetical protein